MIRNIFSISGGKDSCATVLLGKALDVENMELVFADTGHEHPQTLEYLDYFSRSVDLSIKTVKADFSMQIERKRQKLIDGKLFGWTDAMRDSALKVLKPTGIPFLDLCLWKGIFPSTKSRFCTFDLKVEPIYEQVFLPALDSGHTVYGWQGVRRDESLARRYVPEYEEVDDGLYYLRPIARWSAESVFEAHKYMGIKPNPLYKQGMKRVGCMPCINCNKGELREISLRFPEEIDRVREWERLVSMACRKGSTTFFTATDDPTVSKSDNIHFSTHGIDRRVEWSKTGRGGRNIDLFSSVEHIETCSSAYGLCG